MNGSFTAQQARIDAFLDTPCDQTRIEDILLAVAERGMMAPESLSLAEIKKMCFVVSLHFTLDPGVPQAMDT